MENGLSASDVALMSRDGDGFGFGGGGEWIFGLIVLLAIMNGGFGGFGNNGFDRWATQSDVSNLQQFGQILDGNRDIMSQANNNTNSILSAVNSAEYENIAVVKDAQLQLQDRLSDLHAGQQGILAQVNQCCCDTRLELANQAAGINQNIMQNRYEAALNTASINENTTAQTQKILDALSANRMADMQNQINELQLAQATAGVLRYPSSAVYSSPMPWWQAGGCCGNV